MLGIYKADGGQALSIDAINNKITTAFDLYVAGDLTGHFESVTGNYGSVQVDGAEGSSATWVGYSIGGRHVVMDNGSNAWGLYDDTADEWAISITDGSSVWLYYDGAAKFNTTAGGALVTGNLYMESSVPKFVMEETDATANNKKVRLIHNSEQFDIDFLNDAESAATPFFTATRTGNVCDILTLAATTIGVSGVLSMADNTLLRPTIKDYGIKKHTETSSSGTLTIDMSLGNSVTHVMTENITTVSIINPPASGVYGEVLLKIHQHASAAKTITYGSAFKFPGGTHHVMSTGLSSYDMVHFSTVNAGVEWQTTFAQDFS